MIEIVADFLPAQRSLEAFPPGKCWSFPNTMPISFVDVRIGAALLVATRQNAANATANRRSQASPIKPITVVDSPALSAAFVGTVLGTALLVVGIEERGSVEVQLGS